jgi:hypothetical protein
MYQLACALIDVPARVFQADADSVGDSGGQATFGGRPFDQAVSRPESLPPCKRQVRGSSPLFGSDRSPVKGRVWVNPT